MSFTPDPSAEAPLDPPENQERSSGWPGGSARCCLELAEPHPESSRVGPAGFPATGVYQIRLDV